jgi:hypothetical protein
MGVYYRINKDSVVDMQSAIHQVGAIYVSAQVHDGWMQAPSPGQIQSHADLPIIPQSDAIRGGHAFAIVGYNDHGFVVQNSWGIESWGRHGFAVLTYADWVANGSDVWAVSMGVATVHDGLPASTGTLRGGADMEMAVRLGLMSSRDPLSSRSDVWGEKDAYRHALVTGNDGLIINRLPDLADAADAVRFVAREQPEAWFKGQGQPQWRLVIYGHGGLNSEADSIKRVRVLGPNFENNGIYPIFVTWKSGWLEILGDILKDKLNGIFGETGLTQQGLGDILTEASDRMLEVACRHIAVRGMWSEMKENVARSTEAGRGLNTLAAQILGLSKAADAAGARLDVHFIGHSAGAFVAGRMLAELGKKKLQAGSCTLFAPACDVDFALRYYAKPIDGGVLPASELHIHALSDRLECDDSVGPYRKSLLYLICRALERDHRTPVLGMERVYDPAGEPLDELWSPGKVADVKKWQQFVANHTAIGPTILTTTQVDTGANRIPSTHGCFDNSRNHITDAIERILAGPLRVPLTPLDY